MELKIDELKDLLSKISTAVEKSKINPKSGWVELLVQDTNLVFKVSNGDSYYLEASCTIAGSNIDSKFHVTVLAETFIPLISKLDDDTLTMKEYLNMLIIETPTSTYNVATIKELGKPRSIDTIPFKASSDEIITIDSENLVSVATVNLKNYGGYRELNDRSSAFIYVDAQGAITRGEDVLVNTFKNAASAPFKILVDGVQAKLFAIFKNEGLLNMQIEDVPTYYEEPTTAPRLCIYNDKIKLIINTQPESLIKTFPAIKCRKFCEDMPFIHVEVNKKLLENATNRLMVFDKRFSASRPQLRITFKDDGMELYTLMSKNTEKLSYDVVHAVAEQTVIVYIEDLQRHLKTVTTKNADMSYGIRGAIVFTTDTIKQLLFELVMRD